MLIVNSIQKLIFPRVSFMGTMDRISPSNVKGLWKYSRTCTILPHIQCSRPWCSLHPICWKCGNGNNSVMFCKNCNALQKPNKNINYYDILGIDSTFDLDTNDLTKKYRKLQSILHPDKYASSSENERNISEEYSSVVNKAYSTLLPPLARGLYLLELQGVHLEEGNVQTNPEFLMELMERNEEVDQANSESEIRAVSEKNKKMLNDLIKEASKAFKTGNIEEAKEVLIKMKYFSSIEAKIKVLKINKGYME
ncbi:Uncharacterized protein GBIM_14778 [Gryllus bimaculatus]|nr:Uncharacterized protein GBIM_14778 [Gryllus bimaculatus]